MVNSGRENKVLCILPWIHVQIRQNGVVYPCCRVIHPYSYGSVHEQSLSEIWNSEAIRRVRLDMLAGKKLSFCEDCYTTEAMGGKSLRQVRNEEFAEELHRIEKTREDGSVENEEIVYLDLRFSNICNFRCRSCSPESSNSWFDEYPKLHPGWVPDQAKTLKVVAADNSVMKDIEHLLPKIKKIYFAGGEPMLETQHYLILEKLLELGRTDVHLVYNSNLSRIEHMKWKALDLWQKFDRVMISASLDAIGKPLELVRKGADWEQTKRNLFLIRAFTPHVDIQIYPTVSVMNCFHLPELVGYFLKEGYLHDTLDIEFNLLNDPDYLNVGILNDREIDTLETRYNEFLASIKEKCTPELYSYLASELKRVVTFARHFDLEKSRDKFRMFTFTLDKMRNEKTGQVLPELLQLLYEREP